MSSANGFGTKGARNFNQASMPEMANTKVIHIVEIMSVVMAVLELRDGIAPAVTFGMTAIPTIE